MNELRVIEQTRTTKRRRVDEMLEYELSQIHSVEAMEEFIFENIISTDILKVSEYEEDYLTKIVDGLILYRWEISVESFVQDIYEHNLEIICMAIDHFRKNLGNELWMERIKLNYGVESYIDEFNHLNEIDSLILATQRGFEEEIYQQMGYTYFQKIVKFCEANNIELHIDDELEIYDLLFYSNVLENRAWTTQVLMPNIRKAILCPALTGLIRDRVFIMENTLYVPKQAMGGLTNEYVFGG